MAAVGALGLVAAGTLIAGADEGGTVISFQSMTPITGPTVNAVNDRGLKAGSIAWAIKTGTGSVDRDGHVSATVTGLVLVPTKTNPVGTFAAVVSCRTTAQSIVNVQTKGFPANMAGDSTIKDTIALPHPCTTPEVFVGGLLKLSTGQIVFRWFAVSNGDFADAS